MTDQKIPEAERIKELIPTVEKRTNIVVNDFLGKHPLTSPIKTITYYDNNYYGEVNAVGKEHGRGIYKFDDGNIVIGYFKNGLRSTGNYIVIHSDGEFRVGESYLKDGEEWRRGT
jgi:hypothetical protein